jgi:hypothetical protein
MKYPQEAYDYLESEHIRLLIKEHDGTERVPSVDDRVLEAFTAGIHSVHRTNWFNAFGNNISFPRTTL